MKLWLAHAIMTKLPRWVWIRLPERIQFVVIDTWMSQFESVRRLRAVE